MDNNKIKNGAKPLNPLDQRTEEDHAAHLKRWEDFGLLNPDIMDYLTSLNEIDLSILRGILFCDKDLETLNDNLSKYMLIEGLVNDELELAYNDDDTDEESCRDPKN